MDESENKVRQFIKEENIEGEYIKLDESTKTADEASEALGVPTSQIVKSLVFKDEQGELYLVLCSGDKEVDTELLSFAAGKKILGLANPEEIEEKLGFFVGGIPPIGLDEEIESFMDKELMDFEYVYPSGGSRSSMLKIRPQELKNVSNSTLTEI